jgi:hypothetical protein
VAIDAGRAIVGREEGGVDKFSERKKAFEAEFVRNQELAFRITVRRNRLFGFWAAARLGLLGGQAAEAYAKAVAEADFEGPGDADIIRKVLGDFAEKQIAVTEGELRAELIRWGEEARRQLVPS